MAGQNYSAYVRAMAVVSRPFSRHAIPLVGTIVLLSAFMGMSLFALPEWHHLQGWSYTMDIWDNLQLAHLADTGAYTAIYGQGLAETPGIVFALAPVWWIIHAAGMSVAFVFEPLHPTAWLVVGPYEVLLSACALFAFDAVADRLGASAVSRLLICAVEVFALYNVLLWGHPEDAVAVACLLYSCLAASEKRWSRCGWLFGGAVVFEPVVLLALPFLVVVASRRNFLGLLARAAAPTVALLIPPLTMNWSVTIHGLLDQATYPSLNRPTPWLDLAPSLGHEGYMGASAVTAAADGPSRLLAIFLALVLGFAFRRGARELKVVIAVVALTLFLWCACEAVIAPYYVWPTIAVALIGLSTASPLRSAAILIFAVSSDVASNADLHAEWLWWVIVSLLAVLLAVSWPKRRAEPESNTSTPSVPQPSTPCEAQPAAT